MHGRRDYMVDPYWISVENVTTDCANRRITITSSFHWLWHHWIRLMCTLQELHDVCHTCSKIFFLFQNNWDQPSLFNEVRVDQSNSCVVFCRLLFVFFSFSCRFLPWCCLFLLAVHAFLMALTCRIYCLSHLIVFKLFVTIDIFVLYPIFLCHFLSFSFFFLFC